MAYLLNNQNYFTLDDYKKYDFDESVLVEENFDRYLSNAIQLIHANTGNYFLRHDFRNVNEVIQDRVKRAIGAQIEHYFYLQKTSDAHSVGSDGARSITLGRTRIDMGNSNASASISANNLCNDALTYLGFTGLLYRGVRSV